MNLPEQPVGPTLGYADISRRALAERELFGMQFSEDKEALLARFLTLPTAAQDALRDTCKELRGKYDIDDLVLSVAEMLTRGERA